MCTQERLIRTTWSIFSQSFTKFDLISFLTDFVREFLKLQKSLLAKMTRGRINHLALLGHISPLGSSESLTSSKTSSARMSVSKSTFVPNDLDYSFPKFLLIWPNRFSPWFYMSSFKFFALLWRHCLTYLSLRRSISTVPKKTFFFCVHFHQKI